MKETTINGRKYRKNEALFVFEYYSELFGWRTVRNASRFIELKETLGGFFD